MFYYPKLEFGNEFTDILQIFVSPLFHEGSVKLVKVFFDKVLLWPENKTFLRYSAKCYETFHIGRGAMVLIKVKVKQYRYRPGVTQRVLGN